MSIPQANKHELLTLTEDSVSEVLGLTDSLGEHQINAVPYPDSWTPGQLVRHVTKSIRGMANAMEMPGEPAGRDPDIRVEELKGIFLDFSHKMNSPEMVKPEPGPYLKSKLISDLKGAFERLREKSDTADMRILINGLPFGPITRLEILHFVLYHTQRHVHQLKNMQASFKPKDQ